MGDKKHVPENLYLIAGVRGEFRLRPQRIPLTVETELLHTLDRWGISPLPWGPCDSGADLQNSGNDIVRGWTHVDLRTSDESPPPRDVPVSGLLRTTWDAIELFGAITLSGVDAIVPLACASHPLWARVAGSLLRDRDRVSPRPPRAIAEVGGAWDEIGSSRWNTDKFFQALSELAQILGVMDDVESVSYAHSKRSRDPFARPKGETVRAEVELPASTVDDAAWLAEAMAAACLCAGVTNDIQVAVRFSNEDREKMQ